MEYTVCFLFTRDLQFVLLQQKNCTEYAGLFNGVGDKLEAGESELDGALREIREETGVTSIEKLRWLATTILPRDCVKCCDDRCTLHFFAGIVDRDAVAKSKESMEELIWWDVDNVLQTSIHDNPFAGDGDVQYMVNLALRELRKS